MMHPRQKDTLLREKSAQRVASMQPAEIRAERAMQAQFRADVRNQGIHKAVDRMEANNTRVRESHKRAWKNKGDALVSALAPGPVKVVREHGRYSCLQHTEIDGVEGLLAQDYYDGQLVIETFKPTNKEQDHEQAFRHVYRPEYAGKFDPVTGAC